MSIAIEELIRFQKVPLIENQKKSKIRVRRNFEDNKVIWDLIFISAIKVHDKKYSVFCVDSKDNNIKFIVGASQYEIIKQFKSRENIRVEGTPFNVTGRNIKLGRVKVLHNAKPVRESLHVNKDVNWAKLSVIIAAISLIAYLYFEYNKKDSIASENLSFVSEGQTGGITDGKIVNNYYTTSSLGYDQNENEPSIPSAYNIVKKMDNLSITSLEKAEIFKKYIGLSVSDTGYVEDVYKNNNGSISVFIKDTDKKHTLKCDFYDNEAKIATTLNKQQSVRFKGLIKNNDIFLALDKCSFN